MERNSFVDVLSVVLTKCSLDSGSYKSSLKFEFCFESATKIKYIFCSTLDTCHLSEFENILLCERNFVNLIGRENVS
jgi:hypothetical protein